jgi:hypothetical protein
MQSLMRGSKVGPGNVFIPIGEYASRPPTSYAPIFSSESAIAEGAVAEEVYPAKEGAILEVYERDYMVEGVCTAAEAVHWQEREVTDNVAEFVYTAAEEATEEVDVYAAGEPAEEAYETDCIAEVVNVAAKEATEEVDIYAAGEPAEEAYETECIVEVASTAAEEAVQEVNNTDDVEEVYTAAETIPEAYDADDIADRVDFAAEGVVPANGVRREREELFVYEAFPERRPTPAPTAASSVQAVSTPA